MKHKPDVFQAIADPTRRAILILLAANSLTISDLVENFNVSRPAISKHVKVLDEAGLVNIKNAGRQRFCTLNQVGFKEATNWFAYFESFWNQKLSDLENLLNQ